MKWYKWFFFSIVVCGLIILEIFFHRHIVSKKVFAQTTEVSISSWKETASFQGHGHPFPSFALNGRYYVHSTNGRDIYVGTPDATGNITNWKLANDDHGGIHGFTAVVADDAAYHFRNGHIIKYNLSSDGTISGFTRLEPQGDLNAAFEGRLYVWDSAVYAPLGNEKYIFHIGGFSCPGKGCPVSYTYDGTLFKSALPIGDHFTNTGIIHPDYASGVGKSAYYKPTDSADGYIYVTKNSGTSIWSIPVSSGGKLGSWRTEVDMPLEGKGDIFVIDNTLYVIRGKKVYKANLNPQTGHIDTWSDTPPDLPSNQVVVTWGGELEGASWGVIGDYVYVTGDTSVYYAKIDRGASSHPTSSVTPTPSDGGVLTPTATDTPPVSSDTCADKKLNGDYNCDNIVNDADFTSWKSDFLKGIALLDEFEYWRRARFNG